MEEICSEIFKKNTDSIKIKKPKVAVSKLARIIEAALKLSYEKGFHAMSLRDLCKECGLSMGGLYAYFESKDELLRIIQEHGQQMLLNMMSEHVSEDDDPLTKLETATRLHIYMSEAMHDWFYFSYMEARFLNRESRKLAISSELMTEEWFRDILEQGRSEGVFNITDSLLTASVIKAMLQDWYLKRWKYIRRNISVEEYAEHVISWIRSFVET
ncbi:MAG: TetR/AcrR family transcriptional regulator [Desulfobacterales bacterium]|nr:TetR/AcrR family transcriptional regulator [Desulfobacterales bacterium]